MRSNVAKIVLIVMAFLAMTGFAVAEGTEYDILQQMFFDLSDETTQAELDQMIESAGLFSSVQEYNSSDGRYISYVIAYEKNVAKHSRASTGDHIDVSFRKSTGKLFYVSYFNAHAFYADYHKNYEAQKYYEEGYQHQLGFYGHNADASGMGVFKREVVNYVPFDTAEEAMADVLNNAKQYKAK